MITIQGFLKETSPYYVISECLLYFDINKYNISLFCLY